MHMNTKSMGLAVITGAFSGIGAAYADRLARGGYDLLLVAPHRECMDDLAERLAADTQRNVEKLAADLTNSADLPGLKRILRDDSTVTLLVNNAGVGATAPFLNSEVVDVSGMIMLTVEALTRLTYSVVGAFVKRGSGTIINLGSILSIGTESLYVVYGSTNAFVLAFSQSLRQGLANTGVKVQTALSGATATNFWITTASPLENLPQEIVIRLGEWSTRLSRASIKGSSSRFYRCRTPGEWQTHEGICQALPLSLSGAEPAASYATSVLEG
jgi:uncharacterized protein